MPASLSRRMQQSILSYHVTASTAISDFITMAESNRALSVASLRYHEKSPMMGSFIDDAAHTKIFAIGRQDRRIYFAMPGRADSRSLFLGKIQTNGQGMLVQACLRYFGDYYMARRASAADIATFIILATAHFEDDCCHTILIYQRSQRMMMPMPIIASFILHVPLRELKRHIFSRHFAHWPQQYKMHAASLFAIFGRYDIYRHYFSADYSDICLEECAWGDEELRRLPQQ